MTVVSVEIFPQCLIWLDTEITLLTTRGLATLVRRCMISLDSRPHDRKKGDKWLSVPLITNYKEKHFWSQFSGWHRQTVDRRQSLLEYQILKAELSKVEQMTDLTITILVTGMDWRNFHLSRSSNLFHFHENKTSHIFPSPWYFSPESERTARDSCSVSPSTSHHLLSPGGQWSFLHCNRWNITNTWDKETKISIS